MSSQLFTPLFGQASESSSSYARQGIFKDNKYGEAPYLTETNYQQWRPAISFILRHADCLDIADGSRVAPSAPAQGFSTESHSTDSSQTATGISQAQAQAQVNYERELKEFRK